MFFLISRHIHVNGPTTNNTLYITSTISWFFFLLLLPFVTTQDLHPPSPPFPSVDSSSPMPNIIAIMIGFFFFLGFLSLYLRHFAVCLGVRQGGGDPGGFPSGGVWQMEVERGLDPAVVDAFPTFVYSDVKVHRIGKGSLECAVCLNEFAEDEILRLLPGCSHVFHLDCIAPWLVSHVTCPVCRANMEIHMMPPDTTMAQHLQQPSEDESEPLDQITQNDLHDDHRDVVLQIGPSSDAIVMIKSSEQEMDYDQDSTGGIGLKNGGDRRGKLPRSHSTGHSLVEDSDRFTLRLPEEVRNKLVNDTWGKLHLRAVVSPRIGYRVGCTGTVIKPDRWRFSASPPFISRPGSTCEGPSERGNNNSTVGPRSSLKPIKSPLNRVVRSNDIGERSSDRLWFNPPSQGIELEAQ